MQQRRAEWMGWPVVLTLSSAFACANEPGSSEPLAVARQLLGSPVTVELQNGLSGYSGTIDTRLSQHSPATSYGAATTLSVDGDDPPRSGRDSVALFRWSLSGIPAGSRITAARIGFRVTDGSASAYGLHALERDWSESSANWQRARTGAVWQAPGASGPADRAGALLGALSSAARGWVSISLDEPGVTLLQRWLDQPATNHGVILAGPSHADGVDVASSEHTTVAYRPKLSIDYLPPAPPDETPGGEAGASSGGAAGEGAASSGGAAGEGAASSGGAAGEGVGGGGSPSGGSPSGGSPSGGSPSGGSGGEAELMPPAHVYAAGDIGDCNSSADVETSILLDATADPILALGDIAYPSGTAAAFSGCFDPVWGRHKARLRPVPGNHEYAQPGAGPYYAYFGAAAGDPSRGYYSFDIGEWHIVALNSNCDAVSCAAGSAQERWLREDLAKSSRACTLAYWHHPRYSSGFHGNHASVAPLWQALLEHRAELVLSGHDHGYERFVPQDGSGAASPAGIVQFVVGTGGTSLRSFRAAPPANSAVRNAAVHGVLSLVLRSGGFDWQFLPVAGQSFSDQGSASCR